MTRLICLIITLTFFGCEKNQEVSTQDLFVGKWKGSRSTYKWEIDRKNDGTFELVLHERNPFKPDSESEEDNVYYYASGTWSVDGNNYLYKWESNPGDQSDNNETSVELIDKVSEKEIITITPSDDLQYPEETHNQR